jgi:hypothetical protein
MSAQDAAASSLIPGYTAAAFRCARSLMSAQDAAVSSLIPGNTAAAFRCARFLMNRAARSRRRA